jgi:hypothetical protein
VDLLQLIVSLLWLENHQVGDGLRRWSGYLLHGQGSAIRNTFIANGTVLRVWGLYSLPIQMQHQRKVYHVSGGAHHALDTKPFCTQAISLNKVSHNLYRISKGCPTTFVQSFW